MALRTPGVDVEAITVVAGNVPLGQAVQNALYTVELAGVAVPVHAGRAEPRAQPLVTAQDVHGEDGMGDVGLRLGGREPARGDAVDVLVERVRAAPGELTLVTLGPLTNVAEAFERAPDLPRLLRRAVVMGGTSDAVGNQTAVAEYNVWADPEAAALVFASGAPLTMVGWDVSRKYAAFSPREAEELRALGPLGRFAVEIQATLDDFARERSSLPGFDLPDPIAMAVALDAGVATDVRRLHVAVELDGTLTRGQTVVDHLGYGGGEPNVDVVVGASRPRFLELLRAALAS
jgi:purine nucleosidase